MRLKCILNNTLFGMVLVSAMPMQAQQIYTLQSCLEEGLQNNYSIQIVRNDEQITHNNATIANCFVAEGSEIYGTVRHSIISIGCTVGKDALVEDSVVMPGVVIESGAIVRHAILGENSRVGKNCVVGGAYSAGEEKRISVTSKGAVLEDNSVLLPGDMV